MFAGLSALLLRGATVWAFAGLSAVLFRGAAVCALAGRSAVLLRGAVVWAFAGRSLFLEVLAVFAVLARFPGLLPRTELAAWFELAARSVLFFVAFAGRSLWAARVLLAFPAFGPRPPAAAPARSEPDLACTTARSLNAPGRGVAATAGLP